ncbi:MAG: hypothetical protein Q7T81_14735 [Pseudolabrys sp.]|nr:hypothetical protein [Pseudolabrys sp.]
MAQSRLGELRIPVDGEWDMEDLKQVSEGLSDTYGLFYPLVAEDEVVRERLQDALRDTFWSGNMDSRFLGERLYRQIPRDESLKLRSFHYSSPGAMTLAGVLSVLLLMAGVATAWIKVGSNFIDLWDKVEKFFKERKHLQKPGKETELDDAMMLDSDEARGLVFEVGGQLGFTDKSCEVLIGVVGNPISALKFLVCVGREGRKLSTMQREGKLALPAPPHEGIELRSSATAKKRMKGRVEVEIKKSRKPKSE